MKKFLFYITGLILIFTAWQILSILLTPYIVPCPLNTVIRLGELLTKSRILADCAITIYRTLAGFVLAFLAGTVTGILTGSLKQAEQMLFIPVIILQGAPPILWIIPLMLIIGTTGTAPVAVVFLVTLPLVIINVQEGRKSMSTPLWDMFKLYANSKKMILLELILPSLFPYFKSIFMLGLVLAFKTSVIGEWFGAKNGLGRNINEYFYTFDMLNFFATSLILLIVVGLFGWLGLLFGKKFFPVKKASVINVTQGAIPDNFFKKSAACLDIRNVHFHYGSKKILTGADLALHPGETVVLTGDSGVGKTTLARIVTGILKPANCNMLLPGNPGFIFQDDALLPHLDCFGNASLPARWKKTEDYQRITLYFLALCGLKDNIHLFPDQLSGGMKKRLALARALVLNPDFMVMDEPFNNLHKEARSQLWDLYFSLFVRRNIPSLIITHYPEEFEGRAVVYYEMKNGKINSL